MKVLFLGRKMVSADCLKFLSERDGIEVVGVLTDNHLAVSPTSDMATALGIPIFDYPAINRLIASKAIQVDLTLSMLYWKKLGGEILQAPARGAINFHPAPLPDYKGCGGYNLAILDNLCQWGVTAHYMDDEIDTGDIIEVDRFAIDATRDTAQTLEKQCQSRLLEQFKRTVEKVLETGGRLPASPNQGGRYISRAEMESMKEVLPGDDVERKSRAFWFPPYDGAYVMVNGVKCTLVTASILQSLADRNSSSLFSPGSR